MRFSQIENHETIANLRNIFSNINNKSNGFLGTESPRPKRFPAKFMPRDQQDLKCRNYCFTLNNYNEDDIPKLLAANVTYITFQKEVGANGTPHLQGYVELERPTRIPAAKTRLGFPTMHLEKRMGTQTQAIDYCQDPEKRVPGTMFFESGSRAAAGKRTDLEDIKSMCDTGETISSIANNHFGSYIRYHKGIEKYRCMVQQKESKTKDMQVDIYWGPTGTGKTWKAYTENPGAYWICNPNGQNLFFDGYDGQKTIIIDEFYGWIPFNVMLRLCDKYPMPANTKGAVLTLAHTKVVITSNTPPQDWYKNIKADLFAAFTRRITNLVEMTDRYVPTTQIQTAAQIEANRLSSIYPANTGLTPQLRKQPSAVTNNLTADKMQQLREQVTHRLAEEDYGRDLNLSANYCNDPGPSMQTSQNFASRRVAGMTDKEIIDLCADIDSDSDIDEDPFS